MENFVVSARKYRPASFNTVIGQEHVVNTLKNAIKNHHVAHAFLFCGPRGVGKTTSARLLAKTINCTNLSGTIEACNECDSCKAFNNNASFNIYELDAASNNSVEDIRALTEQVRYAPQGSKYKVYIIDEVHMLSASAFNAFLKTLEEPPPYAKFILATTEKHKILPTILSRCQVFDFHRIKIEDAVKQLKTICTNEHIDAEEEALHIIAQKADGAMRDALSIFDRIVSFSGNKISYNDVISNLNILDYDYYFNATNLLIANNLAGILVLFDEVLSNGFDVLHFLNGFSEHIRNLLVCKHPDTLKLLEVSPSVAKKFELQSQTVSSSFLLNGLNLLNQCELNYKFTVNHRLHVELTLLKMANINSVINLKTQQPTVDEKKKMTNESPADNTVNNLTLEIKTDSPPTKLTDNKTPNLVVENKANLGSNKLSKLREQMAQKLQNSEQTPSVNVPVSVEYENKGALTHVQIQSVMADYIKMLEQNKKARISAFLKESNFKVINDYIIEIELKSKFEETQMQEERQELVPFFRAALKHQLVDFVFTINESLMESGKKLTKQEQLQLLSAKNPDIANFIQTLGLEIDY